MLEILNQATRLTSYRWLCTIFSFIMVSFYYGIRWGLVAVFGTLTICVLGQLGFARFCDHLSGKEMWITAFRQAMGARKTS
jgi:hypothetical protein